MSATSSPLLVTVGPGVSPGKVKRSTAKILTRNISKTVTDMMIEPLEHLYVGPTGFRLVTSDLTLDDFEGLKSTPKTEKIGSEYLEHRLRDRAEIL